MEKLLTIEEVLANIRRDQLSQSDQESFADFIIRMLALVESKSRKETKK
jgi:hypothetical protein